MKAIFFSCLVFLCACGTIPTGEAPPPPDASLPPRVTLAAGDKIDLKFFYVPELNETDMLVRPDGKISLQLVGDVQVDGKTPEELAAELKRRYTPFLKHPDVTVIPKELIARRVYVGGEVKTPGLIPMPGRMTALEAILQAGGFDMDKALPDNVIVIRTEGEKRKTYLLNMEVAMAGGSPPPFYLQPYDVVYVPRTRIANVDRWVDQYMNKLIPNPGVGWIYLLRR